jgi:hypothetical protein
MRRVVHLGGHGRGGAHLYCWGSRFVRLCHWTRCLWRLVLSKNETPRDYHMKRIFSICSVSILLAMQQAAACPFCYGAKDGKSTQHMAVAIWFLFGAVMSVLGGIGAFTFQIWRHGRMPLEPYQALNEEDLEKYE